MSRPGQWVNARMYIVACAVLAIAVGEVANAMPPYTGERFDADGISQSAEINRLYEALQSEWNRRGIDQPAEIDFREWLRSTSTTSRNMLCILIEFPDKPAITDAPFFDTLVYGETAGSVRHYYNEVSFNQLDIVTVVLPSELNWVSAENNYSYYTNGAYGLGPYPQNSQKLVEEAVDLVDSKVNFADYDNDGDGYVDGLMVVHTGRGAELSHSVNDIWSHKWAITPRYRDGKYIFTYSMMPEYWYDSGDMTPGVFCHELGHVFGLPDLYDRDYSSNGVGKWSVMAAGAWNGYLGSSPAHFDAWCRIKLGFAPPINITGTAYGLQIPAVESSGTIFRLWTNGIAGNEYFLVENRRKTGYDSALPGEGLAIWHIDDNVPHNDNEWYPGHTDAGHYAVALIQADNNWSLEKGFGHGDNGDLFPGSSGNTAFTPFTLPNSDSYDEQSSLVAVMNISAASDTMTADFFVSFSLTADDCESEASVPEAFFVEQNFPNPFNSGTQIDYNLPGPGDVKIEILNVLGQVIIDVNQGEKSRGAHAFTWNGTDSHGREMPAGIYFFRLTFGDQRQVRKMLFLK